MKKNLIFTGTATALITPFKYGKIDYAALRQIIDFQISSGVNALVIAGTTGEAATLSEYERYKLYSFSSEYINHRVPLIFGTGTNDTRKSVKYTKRAKDLGADAALVVTPYYNKGTDDGLIKHYKTIADSVDLPIILYNVPSRTGVNLKTQAIAELASEEQIVAIKEACDSIDRLTELSALSDKLTIYSGNDSQIHASLSLGGMGVISVLSNALPCEVLAITDAFLRGAYKESLEAQLKILKKVKALFSETNPAPIKYVMHKHGFCRPDMRLPLTVPSPETQKLLDESF